MYYIATKKKFKNIDDPIHENYKQYKLPFVEEINDNENDIVISPEDYTFINFIKKYSKIQKIIWWLSLDNYFSSYFHVNLNKISRYLIYLPYKFINLINSILKNDEKIITFADYSKLIYKKFNNEDLKIASSVNLNLSQSYYVYEYLKNRNYNTELLNDYLMDNFLENRELNSYTKENIICYNPRKATKFLVDFITENKQLNFYPLVGLSPELMKTQLLKSKIYIDFGTPPGRDKIPREAVALSNCILTNKRGSAKNKFDILIPDEFKFEEFKTNKILILKKINDIFQNHSREFDKHKLYLNEIENGKEIFKQQLKKIFSKKNEI